MTFIELSQNTSIYFSICGLQLFRWDLPFFGVVLTPDRLMPISFLGIHKTLYMSQTLTEKLQLADEKNLLIQGLPSSIEKQFSKLSFAKNLTPLLKSRRIDFALVFAVSENQLSGIIRDVLPALKENTKFWVAYPKTTSKIVTDLNRECSWNCLTGEGYESIDRVELDHVWSALRFCRSELVAATVGTAQEIIIE